MPSSSEIISSHGFKLGLDSPGSRLDIFIQCLRFGSSSLQVYIGEQNSASFNNFCLATPERNNPKNIHTTKGKNGAGNIRVTPFCPTQRLPKFRQTPRLQKFRQFLARLQYFRQQKRTVIVIKELTQL